MIKKYKYNEWLCILFVMIVIYFILIELPKIIIIMIIFITILWFLLFTDYITN